MLLLEKCYFQEEIFASIMLHVIWKFNGIACCCILLMSNH